MAYVVLTNSQKEELKGYADFKEEVKWSILNKAAYWKGLDGTSVLGNNWIKWAKCRSYGSSVIYNPQQIDPNNNQQLIDRFLVYIKNIACVDDSVSFDPSLVVTWLLNNPAPNGNHFESMAENWFDDATALVLF